MNATWFAALRFRLLGALLSTVLIPVAISTTAASTQSHPEGEQQVRKATDQFLHAFENLDLPRFVQCFSEDATVFFPIPEPPLRFDGRQAIQSQFQQVFAAIRQHSESSTPPFHHLVPEHLQIQLLDDTTALVTFQMAHPERVARRTLIFQKRGESWLIVHLHASNVSTARE